MEVKRWMQGLVFVFLILGLSVAGFGQSSGDPQEKSAEAKGGSAPQDQPRPTNDAPAVARQEIIVPAGTRIPLSMVNNVSSRTAQPGDPVYLTTIFPIVVGNQVVIPIGSYVRGTITEAQRSGRIKGRAEMYIRFDSLTLPNGTTRDFNAILSQADANIPGRMKEGKIESEGTKGKDVARIAGTTMAGAGIGTIAGGASGNYGKGVGIGAGAGALAGLITTLSTRGNEVNLFRGTEVDMTLDRNLMFDESELGPNPPRDQYNNRTGPRQPYYDQYGRRKN